MGRRSKANIPTARRTPCSWLGATARPPTSAAFSLRRISRGGASEAEPGLNRSQLTSLGGAMIFRLSQRHSIKIKVTALTARPLDEAPFTDWSAHLFTANRTQYIIVSNTKSLYSTVLYGKGLRLDMNASARCCPH